MHLKACLQHCLVHTLCHSIHYGRVNGECSSRQHTFVSIKYALPGEPDSGELAAEACLLLAAAGGAAVEAVDGASVRADGELRTPMVTVVGAAGRGAESIEASRLFAELSDRDCRQQQGNNKMLR